MPGHLVLPPALQSGAAWWTSGPSSTRIETSSTYIVTGVATTHFPFVTFYFALHIHVRHNNNIIQIDRTESGTRIRSWLDSVNNPRPAKLMGASVLVARWTIDHYHLSSNLAVKNIWRVFHFWLRFITFGSHSAHLDLLVHKSGFKHQSIINHLVINMKYPRIERHQAT